MASKLSEIEEFEDYPTTIHLDSKDLPAMKDWKVGKKYTITLEVRQASRNEYEDSKKVDGSFVILKASTGDDDDNKKAKTNGKMVGKITDAMKKKADEY